jgi:hypothetical protein
MLLPSQYSSQHMESSVTRLLVATKMLLEALTKWSLGQKSETQVSDIYVRLGNDFNVANVAFGSYGIDMSDLISVPDDLRVCLERCLSEDPSPQTLEIHLPRIREIIIGLLQGLKAKQAEYKQYLVQSRASARLSRSRNDRVDVSEESQQSSTSRQSSESDLLKRNNSVGMASPSTLLGTETVRRSILNQGGKRPMQAPPLETAREEVPTEAYESVPEAQALARLDSASSHRSGEGSERGGAILHSFTEAKKEANSGAGEAQDNSQAEVSKELGNGATRYSLTDQGLTRGSSEEDVVGQLPPSSATYSNSTASRRDLGHGTTSSLSNSTSRQGSFLTEDVVNELGDAADPSVRALKSRDALERRASKRFSAYTFNKMGVGLNQGMGMSSYALSGAGGGGSGSSNMNSPLGDRHRMVSSSSRRGIARASTETPTSEGGRDYFPSSGQKTHKGKLPSEDIIEEGRPLHGSPSKRSNSLRKGSKTSPGPSPRGGNTLRLHPAPSQLGLSTAASSTDSLPFVDASNEGHQSPADVKEESGLATLGREEVPPVPPLPSAEETARLSALQSKRSSVNAARHQPTSPSTRTSIASIGYGGGANLPSSLISSGAISSLHNPKGATSNGNANSVSVFLQLGRQTRKATVDIDPNLPVKGLSVGKLRMLFMDKFSYSPGKEDFPTIYLKDVGSGVTYELEDLNDVGEGSVLTLNIEPLDQVKQHLDLSLSNITRELRELKAAVHDRDRDLMGRRLSSMAKEVTPAAAETIASPPTLKISDAQFAMAGARVAQFKQATMSAEPADPSKVTSPIVAGAADASNWRGAGVQIKQQYDEVQKLRRQLAIINQIQDEFKSEIGGLLGALREQTNKVKSIAASEVPTERNYIIAGKARLDASSQEILTLVEDLLDSVDDLKADVIQRGVKPKAGTMKQMQADIARATKGLEDLSSYVETVKPSWKKTWELELQNIVDEQEFLNHQEGLIVDLKEDHYNLQEVFFNIQEVVKLRGANKFTLTAGANSSGSDNFLGGVALKSYIPPPPEEGHEGLTTVMMDIKTQSVDHEKRLKALQAAERQRLKELSQRKGGEDEFQSELSTFVDGKVLRKTGGYQETERVRTRRDKLTMQAMFSGGTNIVGGAPIDSSASPPPKKLTLPKISADDLLSGGESGSGE